MTKIEKKTLYINNDSVFKDQHRQHLHQQNYEVFKKLKILKLSKYYKIKNIKHFFNLVAEDCFQVEYLSLHKKEVIHLEYCSTCNQIRRKFQIWSYLLKKSLTKKFNICAIFTSCTT